MRDPVKYLVLVPDGAADYPDPDRGGMTPLQAAHIPHMDALAAGGICGLAITLPEGLPAGSDVANFSIMGYDPRVYYTGRGPLEAASLGVELAPEDVAFRCNLVTVSAGRLEDYSAGHITTNEARGLISTLQRELGGDGISFHTGVSYRHLLVLRGLEFLEARCCPPHDVVGSPLEEVLPAGEGAGLLRQLMMDAAAILESHPINEGRKRSGLPPANMIWPWGQGRPPCLPSVKERYGISGAVITAVDLIKGLGMVAGMEVVEVPGATGYYDTDYGAKGEYAAKSLEEKDLVFVHIEAPDEAGHEGKWEEKVKALEMIDSLVLGKILERAERNEMSLRVLLLPDHPTPLKVRTHTRDPVPFALYGVEGRPGRTEAFHELSVERSGLGLVQAWKLLDALIRGTLEGLK